MDFWRQFLVVFFILLSLAAVSNADNSAGGLVTCFKCLANDTRCTDTCMGKYCYKSELSYDGQEKKYIKRGCMTNSDVLSKVGECTDRPSQLPGGTTIVENFCICTTDKCNGSASAWSSVAAFFTAVIAFLWKD